MGNAIIQNPVDRENHIVHGVKVLGFTSANGRIYDFAAVKEAIQKYEKAPVNKDHNMEEPSFSDRLGWLENVTLEKDGLYADFHYNPHADGIESFLWFAEHNGLGDVGFSHLVSGKYSVDPDGTERITRIDKVKSVDLVANPATTKTIFESERSAMKEPESIKEAMSSGEIDRLKNEFSKVSNQSIDDDQLSRLRELFSQLDQGSLIKIFKAKMGVNGIVSRLALNHIKGGLDSVRNSKESMEEAEKIQVNGIDYDNMDQYHQAVKDAKERNLRYQGRPGSKKRAINDSNKKHWNDLAKHETGTKREADYKIKHLDTGNNESLSRGIEKNKDGTYTALTYSASKTFKTLAGAKKWFDSITGSKSEQEDKPMGKKIAKEAGNAANKVKKNELDRQQGVKNINRMLTDPDIKYSSWHPSHLKQFDNPKAQVSLGRNAADKSDNSLIGVRAQRFKNREQEDDSVEEAYKDQPSDPYDLGVFIRKQGGKKTDNPFGDGIGTGKTFNSDQFDRGFSGRPRAVFKTKPGDPGEQEGDDVGEARAEPKPTLTNQSYWNKSYEALKSIGKQAREASARMLKMGDMKNAMRYDEQNADAATVLGYRERNPKDPIKPEQEGDDEMDKEKLMEDENPMQQEEAEQDPMMEEEEDVYAKIKEICEGEGSDEEKSKQVLEMLGLSGGMSEAEDDEEMKEDDDEETKEQDSEVLENDDEEMKEDDDEEMKEDDDEDPRKESKSELKSLRKWKSEKLKQEKIVNLIKESNLEPTKVFVKQLSAIDSKLWGEAIRDRRKVALTRAAVKPISSGSQSRSESSYKQFLESVLGK